MEMMEIYWLVLELSDIVFYIRANHQFVHEDKFSELGMLSMAIMSDWNSYWYLEKLLNQFCVRGKGKKAMKLRRNGKNGIGILFTSKVWICYVVC